MIKNITAGPGLVIEHNHISMPYFNMTAPSAGMLRYNGGSQAFEVYDGFAWITMYGLVPQVNLDTEVYKMLVWASKKMKDEQELDALCQKYPALEKAKEKFDLVRQIVTNDND